MPLDYSLWDEIEGRVLAKRKIEDESLTSYKRRLHLTARRLPRTLVQKCVSKMKGNLMATVASRGDHTRLD